MVIFVALLTFILSFFVPLALAQSVGECSGGQTYLGDELGWSPGCAGSDPGGQPGQPGQPSEAPPPPAAPEVPAPAAPAAPAAPSFNISNTNENTNNNTNNNTNTTTVTNNSVNQNSNSSSSTSSSNSTNTTNVSVSQPQGGAVAVPRVVSQPAVLAAVTQQPQVVRVAGVSPTQVQELPKTGLPLLAWAAGAFIPAGMGLKRFGRKLVEDMIDHPQFMWEERQFKRN